MAQFISIGDHTFNPAHIIHIVDLAPALNQVKIRMAAPEAQASGEIGPYWQPLRGRDADAFRLWLRSQSRDLLAELDAARVEESDTPEVSGTGAWSLNECVG